MSRKTKAELEKEIEELKASLAEREQAKKVDKIATIKEIEAVSRVEAVKPAKVMDAMDSLKKTLENGLALKSDIDEAIKVKRRELSDLLKIEESQLTIAQILHYYDESLNKIKASIDDAQDRLTKALDENDDYEAKLKESRKRENEEYAYKLKISRQKEMDNYEDLISRKKKELAEMENKKNSAYSFLAYLLDTDIKDVDDVEMHIKFAFENKVNNMKKDEAAKTFKELSKEFETEKKFLVKDHEAALMKKDAELAASGNLINTLQKQLESSETMISRLNAQIQTVTSDALKSQSGAEALNAVNKLVAEQSKAGKK